MARSMTERTLTELRRRGFIPKVVEKWIPQTKRRVDCFSADILAAFDPESEEADPMYSGPRILLVQSTSSGNLAKRMTKIEADPQAKVFQDAGVCPCCRFRVAGLWGMGWRKRARSKTTPDDRRIWVPNEREPW